MNHYFVICDGDQTYAQRLAEYMISRKMTYMNVELFTDGELAVKFCETHRVYCLVIHEELYDAQKFSSDIPSVVFLSENPDEDGDRIIYKYQAADIIMERIMCENIDGENGQQVLGTSSVHVIGLYSPVRRASTTSCALAVAHQLSRQHKTLYLNLCAFSGVEEYLGKVEGPDLSDVMYCMQTGREQPESWLNESIKKGGELFFVSPMLSPTDVKSISAECWTQFLDILAKSGQFEYIILEIDELIQGFFEVLDYCDMILTPVLTDELSKCQFLCFEELLVHMNKSSIRQRICTFTLPKIEDADTREQWVWQIEEGPYYISGRKLLDKTLYAEVNEKHSCAETNSTS